MPQPDGVEDLAGQDSSVDDLATPVVTTPVVVPGLSGDLFRTHSQTKGSPNGTSGSGSKGLPKGSQAIATHPGFSQMPRSPAYEHMQQKSQANATHPGFNQMPRSPAYELTMQQNSQASAERVPKGFPKGFTKGALSLGLPKGGMSHLPISSRRGPSLREKRGFHLIPGSPSMFFRTPS